MFGTSNIDQEPAIPFPAARIRCVERLRIRRRLFEHSKDRFSRIREGPPCRGPSIIEQRREPTIQN